MNCVVRKIVSGISLSLVILSLSGCATRQLASDIKHHENDQTLYNSDVIMAATVTDLGNENYRWVFVGNHFDYSLSSGAEDFLRALVTGKIDKNRLATLRDGEFMLNKDKNQFRGEIRLKYFYRDRTERDSVISVLKLSSDSCSPENGDAGECEISLIDLNGTIHQKNSVPVDVFRFNHPFNVSFYTQNSLSAKRVLYPVAVVTDVAMSPLYLLGGVAVLTLYGTVSLH